MIVNIVCVNMKRNIEIIWLDILKLYKIKVYICRENDWDVVVKKGGSIMFGGFMEMLKKDWFVLVLISVFICGIILNVWVEEKSGWSGYIELKLVFFVISDVYIKEIGMFDLCIF